METEKMSSAVFWGEHRRNHDKTGGSRGAGAHTNDICRCIAQVYRWGALRPHRCSNPVWKDGYCKTHHMKIPALNLLPKKENTVR